MADFSVNIADFKRYGTYAYEFDEAGNTVLNAQSEDFSQVYLAFPLGNFVYDNNKIVQFYDPTFTEFVPSVPEETSTATTEELQSQLETEQAKNAAMEEQLNQLIEESVSPGVDETAAKQVILELRKALGQGRVNSDFNETFPYAQLKKASSIESTTTNQTTGSQSTE